MESSDNLASTHKTFTNHRQYYSVVDISFLWDGGGGNILWYNILTPPPPKNIKEQYFANGIQWQLSFKTQNIYVLQTWLFRGLHFFFMRWGGGQNIMV